MSPHSRPGRGGRASARFAELDWQQTALGAVSLRRRMDPALEVEVFEVKLDDEFLMSSLFTVAETELAELSLAHLPDRSLDVVVGGLGLGYTARAVLQDRRVRSLTVVEALLPVIQWHERGLLPLASDLCSDPRCRLVEGDFFRSIADQSGTAGGASGQWDAVLVDIDHSPRHVLHPDHAAFYQPDGLRRLAQRLRPGGVFGLWSDDPPDAEFIATLEHVFPVTTAHVVTFPNHHTGGTAENTVYVASRDHG